VLREFWACRCVIFTFCFVFLLLSQKSPRKKSVLDSESEEERELPDFSSSWGKSKHTFYAVENRSDDETGQSGCVCVCVCACCVCVCMHVCFVR
jgi:hypothetical protein